MHKPAHAREIYADIIDLEPFVSPTRPRMPRLSRAAQFSPFAALTGYEDLIAEAARETDRRIVLDEDEKRVVNDALVELLASRERREAEFTYFVSDEKKSGGSYRTARGSIVKYDDIARTLKLSSGDTFAVDDLLSVELLS